jgi:catechol 2,3-dioxygenase-like lactoylglutathione lyase family enzyme
VLGRFLELSLATPDITASVHFYEQLGFRQLACTDSWPHAYCALGDGQFTLGLHQRPAPHAALCFVHADLALHARTLRAAGFEPEVERLGVEQFHELQLRDPDGGDILLLEARTFSPAALRADTSRCGTFLGWSLPTPQPDVQAAFWERAGLVAFATQSEPWPHRPVTGDGIALALHDPALLAQPALVYAAADLPERLAALAAAGIEPQRLSAGAASRRGSAFLRAPEGTLLWCLPE